MSRSWGRWGDSATARWSTALEMQRKTVEYGALARFAASLSGPR